MRRSLFDPTISTVLIIIVLLVFVLPVGLAYWYFRMYLYIVGDIIVAVFGLAVLILLIAATGWAFSKWRQPSDAIPIGKSGEFILYRGRIISLKHLVGVETGTGIIPAINHIPVSIEYLANRDTGPHRALPAPDDEPEYWGDPEDDLLPTLDELRKDKDAEPHSVSFNYETTEEVTEEDPFYQTAKKAYAGGKTSRRALSEEIGCTEHHARKLIKRIETEVNGL